MNHLQARLVRNVVKDEVRAVFPDTSKEQLNDITSNIMDIQISSRTKTTAAIIRCLDSYYGVSETTLALGSRIYEELWGDADD